jgi:AcrR family transcriptional regulator
VFPERAFDDVSTREIAERAGVTPATLFRHFGSKQALFDEATKDRSDAEWTDPGARDRILDAARTLFADQGYAKTSTRDIARTAGVHEKALYRHFSTKANLFREAILEPFASFVRAFGSGLPTEGVPEENPVAAPPFVRGLFELLRDRRSELLTLVATRLHEGPELVDIADQQDAMARVVEPLSRTVTEYCGAHGLSTVDAAVATRLTLAMIGGMAIFEDWLFPSGSDISPETIVTEMTAFVGGGFQRCAPHSPPCRSGPGQGRRASPH